MAVVSALQIKVMLSGLARLTPNWSCNPPRRQNPPAKYMLVMPRLALPRTDNRPMSIAITNRSKRNAPAATMAMSFRPVSIKTPMSSGMMTAKHNIGADLAKPCSKKSHLDEFGDNDRFASGGIFVPLTIHHFFPLPLCL